MSYVLFNQVIGLIYRYLSSLILLLPLSAAFFSVSASASAIEGYLGTWCVYYVERFKAGGASTAEAKSRIGQPLIISPQQVSSFHITFGHPQFKHLNNSLSTKSIRSLTTDSFFYGIYTQRTEQEQLIITPSNLTTPTITLERLDKNVIFELYDSFVYAYRRCD